MRGLRRDCPHAHSDERGAILILSALIMILILLIAAFATDLGAWYRQGQEQQRSADVASLNGVQAYDDALQAYFTSKGVNSWGELSGAQQIEAETLSLDAAMNAIVGVLSAGGTTISTTPTYSILPPPNESSVSVTADDGSVVTVTRTVDDEILISVSRPGKQFFSSVVRSAPTIERTATAVLSNCGAECNIPIVLNPPFQGFSATGKGDGYGPLLYGDEEVWAVNHHVRSVSEGEIICMDRDTEAFCSPSGQFSLQNFDTGNRPVEYIDEAGGKIYFTARDRSMGTPQSGLACFDIVSRSYCGTSFVPIFNQPSVNWPNTINVSGPWAWGSKLYIIAHDGQIGCVTKAMVACGTFNSAAAGRGEMSNLTDSPQVSNGEQIGSKVYITQNTPTGTMFHCWDLASESACWGSAQFVNYLSNGGDDHLTHLRYNSSGTANGICVMDIISLRNACFDLSGGGQTENTAMNTHLSPLSNTWGGDAFTFEGKRTFYAGGNANNVGCWDWETNSGCGILDLDVALGQTVNPYGFSQVTGECIIGLGHNSIFYSFNPYGMTACTDTTVDTTINPCQCADGSNRWGVVQIPASLLAKVDELKATVTEPDGDIVVDQFDLIASGGWMDLGNADQTAPFLHLTLEVNSKLDLDGKPLWTEPISADLSLVVQPTLAR